MKLRPLVVADAERAMIRRVIDHAARNVISRDRLQRTIAGEEKPVGDNPDFACVIPVGYRCVYSLEEQPLGVCRHLSISVLGEGGAPNEAMRHSNCGPTANGATRLPRFRPSISSS